ncbi:hypothetical protein M885DRAFT_32236 [Pelagophyceae sp. CCMP2097]|nr:hypothetical protein M885DRAFT_32236 [Pelagophyceae sp. CCMP2097]
MQGFNWTIPANVQGTYNVSTADFDAWRGFSTSATDSAIDASYNGAQQSPVTTDPTANFAGFEKEGEVDFKFKLNVDTSQFPRTFQDRSHTFRVVRNRPAGVTAGARIFNLGVRGRRGNIVQTYPSVECVSRGP